MQLRQIGGPPLPLGNATQVLFGDIHVGHGGASLVWDTPGEGHLEMVKEHFRQAVRNRTSVLDEQVRILQAKANKTSAEKV